VLVGLTACSGDNAPSGPSPRLAISVAPLTLSDIGDAEFALHVYNAAGDLVWEEGSLWASQYGAGGKGLAYVGTCDATAPATNTVQLVLKSLKNKSGGSITPDTWVNPAPDVAWPNPKALVRTVTCVENADAEVVFNLVIARDARQGFFDIAVEFEDVFCSGKLDCTDALLHGPSGERETTAVMAFACAAGNNQPVSLYLTNITITCTDGATTTYSHSFRAAAEDQGNQGSDGEDPSAIFQVGHYWGKEQFAFDKCYWNHAFGLDLEVLATLGSCELEAWGTASHEDWLDLTTPDKKVYPVVHWKAPLTANGVLACTQSPLGSPEVAVEYVDGETRQGFGASYLCGSEPVVGDQEIACGASNASAELLTDGTLTVTVYDNGQAYTHTQNIGSGTRLTGECCLHACCVPPVPPPPG